MIRIFILLCLVANASFANVAMEELKGLLLKKEAVKTHYQKPNSGARDLAENYYFVFIYKSTCPHCHTFAPILKDFSKSFQMKVVAYSLDQAPIDGFDGKPLTPKLFQAFYADGGYKPAVPALFMVNRHTLEAYAVLFGEATPWQLARRVDELHQHIEEKFRD